MDKDKEFKIVVTFIDSADSQYATVEFGGHIFPVCPRLLTKSMNQVCAILNKKLVNPYYNHKTK